MTQAATIGLVPIANATTAKSRTREDPSGRLRTRDETNLEWFWCFGESLFSRSTFGAQLARAEMESFATHACAKCGGNGFDSEDGSCSGCRGMGFVAYRRTHERRPQTVLSTRDCPGCDTPGKRRRLPGECPLCKGNQYVETRAIGAGGRVNGEEQGYTVDDEALRRYAVISRQIATLERESVRARIVLELFLGLYGLRWGRTQWGRIYAVGPATETGSAMIAAASNKHGLSPLSLWENIVADQAKKGGIAHGKQVQRAVQECASDYADACRTFNRVVYP